MAICGSFRTLACGFEKGRFVDGEEAVTESRNAAAEVRRETRPEPVDAVFEVSSFDKVAEHLTSLELEGLNENNVHKFLHQMRLLWE